MTYIKATLSTGHYTGIVVGIRLKNEQVIIQTQGGYNMLKTFETEEQAKEFYQKAVILLDASKTIIWKEDSNELFMGED